MRTRNCSQCGNDFSCTTPGGCWCTQLPMIMPMETGSDCLCPQCLPEKINLKIEEFISTHSVQDAVATAQKYKTPELLENIDYVIEEGKWIFSKWYHLKRGTCCESGCIHCPYDED